MEDEIDIKPYLLAVWQNKLLIAALGFLGFLFAALIGLPRLNPLPQFAAQRVIVIPIQLSDNQRLTLEELAVDETIEVRVADMLRAANALPPDYQLGSLKARVAVELQGNLIRITTKADTKEKAQQLVQLWTDSFIQTTTEIFSQDNPVIDLTQRQLAEAQVRYREAQAALETFIASGELSIASQEVRRLSDLVESARGVTFTRLNEYLGRRNEIELILRDARILQSRLLSEGNPNVADSIAALLLRIRNLSARGSQPILQFDSSITALTEVSASEIKQLIQSLEEEYRAVSSEIEQLKAETDVARLRDLNAQLSAAQVRLEQLNARQRELSNERDLTLNKVTQLRQRLEELQTASPTISLRVVQSSEAIVRPVSQSRSLLLYGAVGGVAGVILGIGFVVGREALRLSRLLPETQQKPIGD